MRTENSVLFLEGDLTVDHAAELRHTLLDMVRQYPAAITLDTSQVTGMDMAILQLLVSVRHSLAAQGGRLALRPMPQVLQKILEETGLPL